MPEPVREAAAYPAVDVAEAAVEYVAALLADRDRLAGVAGTYRAALEDAAAYLETRGASMDRELAKQMRAALSDSTEAGNDE